MKFRTNQSGSVHIIVAAVVAAALLSAIGFVFWQNFIAKKSSDEPKVTQQTEKKQEPPKEEKTDPLPDLLDYGKDGVAIKAEADLAKLTNASDAFKAFILNEVKNNSKTIEGADGPIACNATITVRKLYKQTYAEGSFETTCGPQYLQVWGSPDGSWKVLAGAHATWYMCEPLRQYKVPSIIIDNKCFETSGEIEYQQS